MTLEDLGYNAELEAYRHGSGLDSFGIGRVTSEHKERYAVKSEIAEFDSELIGNLRYTAQSRFDFPAVGDWVAFTEYDDNKALIHAVYPRKSILARQAVGKFGEKQIIAANIDYAFIIQAVDRDFNINRLERYLTICNTSQIDAIIVLNKIDLINTSELNDLIEQVKNRVRQIPVLAISNENHSGYDDLLKFICSGKTYCLLGSSGVGKSTLLNNISGREVMKTNSISTSNNKGRHVTSHRELVVLEQGGILIDNPGMREIGIPDAGLGIELTFDDIYKLAHNCYFSDCTHTHEKGCAILEAVKNNMIDNKSYENYLKMEKERSHFESTQLDRRRKEKSFGKMVKEIKKINKLNKY